MKRFPTLGLPRIDQLGAPTADVSMNSHKLTNLTDGSSAQDAVTKSQLDAIVTLFPIYYPLVDGDVTEDAGTWSVTTGLYGNFGSHADADKATVTITVPITGTYTLYIAEARGDNHAKYDVQLDGVKQGSTLDQYAASTQSFKWTAGISLGTLTANTVYGISLLANGKNVANVSSDYYLTFRNFLLVKA